MTGVQTCALPISASGDVLFILLGAIMVLAMHAGFAFLELGTVRSKNQVNALVKILADFAVSTIAYFFVGYSIAYGVDFFGVYPCGRLPDRLVFLGSTQRWRISAMFGSPQSNRAKSALFSGLVFGRT